MLEVVSCVLAVVCNGCSNSQQCWDLQCIVERIQPIGLCKPCVMSVRGPKNVRTAVQTDPTLLRYASAITEQKKCWELLAEKYDRFQTLRNNTQQHPTTCNSVCKRTQHITSNNVGSCWPTILRPFARGLSDVFVAVAVVVAQAPIIHAERSYIRPTNIQEKIVMFNVNFQEEFMEREIKMRPLLKHASYHN